jgi:hypothetical protein
VNDVLTELLGRPSGGHLGINKTLNNFQQSTTGPRHETIMRSGATSATSVLPVAAPIHESGPNASIHIAASFGKAGPFPQNDQGHGYLLMAIDCFTKWQEAYVIANQVASTVAEILVTNFLYRH